MNAYSVDLRQRVLDALEGGMSRAQVVETFQVSLPTIKRYLKLRRDTGEIAPKPSPGRPPKISPQQHGALEAQLREQDTATLTEHVRLWRTRQGVSLSISAMSRAIKRLGWTRKKGRWVPVSEMRGHGSSGESS